MKKARAAAYAAAAIASSAGILLIPTPLRVQGTLVLKLAKPAEIYAEVEGRLVELKVRDGDWVKKDTVIAKLSNPSKEHELVERQQDHDIAWSSRPAGICSSPELENRAQAKQHEEFATELRWQIEKVADQLGKLTLDRQSRRGSCGSPHKETVGQWIKPGKPFCEVGDPHQLEAHMIIDQSDIHLLNAGSNAWIKIYGRAENTFRSRVSEIANGIARRFRPSFRTRPAAKSRPSPTPRPEQPSR